MRRWPMAEATRTGSTALSPQKTESKAYSAPQMTFLVRGERWARLPRGAVR